MDTAASYFNAFSIVGSTVGATVQAGEPPANGGTTVWYKWIAPSSEEYEFSANLTAVLKAAHVPLSTSPAAVLLALKNSRAGGYWGQFSALQLTDQPVEIRIYTGTTLANLIEVAYVTGPALGNKAQYEVTSFVAAAAVIYYVRVDSIAGKPTGNFVLTALPCRSRPCNNPLAIASATITDVGQASVSSFGSVPPGDYTVSYCSGAFCYRCSTGSQWVSDCWFGYGTKYNIGGQLLAAPFPQSRDPDVTGQNYPTVQQADAAGRASNLSMQIQHMNQFAFGLGPPSATTIPAWITFHDGNYYADLTNVKLYKYAGGWVLQSSPVLTVGSGVPSANAADQDLYVDLDLNGAGNHEYYFFSAVGPGGFWTRGTLNDVYATFFDSFYADNIGGPTPPTFGLFVTQQLCICQLSGSCAGISVAAPSLDCSGSAYILQTKVSSTKSGYFRMVLKLSSPVGFTPITTEVDCYVPPNSSVIVRFYIDIPIGTTAISGSLDSSLADATACGSLPFNLPVQFNITANGVFSNVGSGDDRSVAFKVLVHSFGCNFVNCTVTLQPLTGMTNVSAPLTGVTLGNGNNSLAFTYTQSVPNGTSSTCNLLITDSAGKTVAVLVYNLTPIISCFAQAIPIIGSCGPNLSFRQYTVMCQNSGLAPTKNLKLIQTTGFKDCTANKVNVTVGALAPATIIAAVPYQPIPPTNQFTQALDGTCTLTITDGSKSYPTFDLYAAS